MVSYNCTIKFLELNECVNEAILLPAIALTSTNAAAVANCVLVFVDAIVTAPADSVIVTFEPAVKANVSELASVLPPAVTGL